MNLILQFVLILLMSLVSAPVSAQGAAKKPFTVNDAIELNVLNEQRGKEISVSPSGDRFFIVTSRGTIEKNAREFRLEIYTRADIDELLDSNRTGDLAPAQSVTLVSFSNRDAISDARWDADGKGISFLGAEGDAPYQVYHYDLRRKRSKRITDSSLDVTAFDHRGGTTIYAARTSDGAPNFDNISSVTITDEALPTLIFPEDMYDRHEYSAFVIGRGDSAPRQLQNSKRVVPFIYDFSISPDGSFAAALLPADDFPDQWRRYQPPANEGSNAGVEQRGFQFQLIDLETLKARPLIDAPVAWVVWNRNRPMAVWSNDSSKLLLTSTMAPLSSSDVRGIRERVPVILIQEFEKGVPTTQSVLHFFDELPEGETLVSAQWDEEDGVFRLYTAGGRTPETYGDRVMWKAYDVRRENGSWHIEGGVTVEPNGAPGIGGRRLSIMEDANTPPALWATGKPAEEKIRLRDFNPQLSEIVLANVESVQWTDKNGKPWSGALILPKNRNPNERIPLVIELKFASPSKFRPDGPYTTAFATQALAARGIAVLEVNAFDQETMNSSKEALTQLNGIEAAIAYLDARKIIDTKRVGLIGFSRTAYYVKYALTHSDFDFAAAALSDGVDAGYVQYVVFGVNYYESAAAEDYAALNGARPYGEGLSAWMKNAPGFNTDKVHAPLRIEAIGKSSVLQEWEFFSGLKMTGKPVEMNYIPHGTHVLVKPQERLSSQQGNVDWFDFWLNETEGELAKGQVSLESWRAMRENQCKLFGADKNRPWYCDGNNVDAEFQ